MKYLLYFSISLITIFPSFSQCPDINFEETYSDISNQSDTLYIYSFEDPSYLTTFICGALHTELVAFEEVGGESSSAIINTEGGTCVTPHYSRYDFPSLMSRIEKDSLLVFNFLSIEWEDETHSNQISQSSCPNYLYLKKEYSILDSLIFISEDDTILLCENYGWNDLELNYTGQQKERKNNRIDFKIPFEINSNLTNYDSLLIFYINNQVVNNLFTIDQLKNGDELKALRVVQNENDTIGTIYEYDSYNKNYKYKYEFVQNKDSIWSNTVVIKKVDNPTNTILTASGATNICPGDFPSIVLNPNSLKPNFQWMRNLKWLSSQDYTLSSDKTILTPFKSGIYNYVQTNGYTTKECPFVSNSIDIIEITDCIEGVVEGIVLDKSHYPYKPLQGVLIESNNGYFGISDSTGKYKITFPNTDTIKQVFITSDQFSYASTNVIFDNNFLYSGNNDLQSYFVQNKDLSITISSERNRPGFTIPYTITVLNKGKTDTITNLIFDFDSQLTFINSDSLTPNPITLNNKLKWNNLTLTSGTTKRFKFYLKLDSTAILGGSLINIGNLDIQDDIIENNSYSYSPVIVGSYDPNDKQSTILEAEDAVILSIEGDFEYLIRFQNTGTDTAFTVRVTDSLDIDLELRSLRMIDASHNYEMSISNRTITWLFNEIKLVDSTTNEPASHGFIRFKISQSVNNSIGTELRNKANIFFDYNLPIVTNEVVNIVGESLYSPVSGFDNTLATSTTIYPNPSDKQLIIKGDFEDKQVFIYSISGVRITPEFINKNTINLESIKSGIYIISIGERSYKFIKQ